MLATSYARQGGRAGHDRAIDELNKALRISPGHYWSTVLRGICHLEKGDHISAAGDFGLCAGLRPDLVWGYFNRGCVLDRSGRKAEAIEDYTSALGRDPRFVPALINRGLARLELRRYARALETSTRHGPSGGGEDATLFAGRGMGLEGLGRHAEPMRVRPGVRRRGLASGAERTRLLWTYGFAVTARSREGTRGLRGNPPRRPPTSAGTYGLAMLSMNGGRPEEAVASFNRRSRRSRFHRGPSLPFRGPGPQLRLGGASRDIRWCLEREPGSSETLYAAACVSSLAAAKLRTPETLRQSLDLLRQALDRGAGLDKFAADPDLAALRGHPDFERLRVRSRDDLAQRNGPRPSSGRPRIDPGHAAP
ncbi:MAG: tetratricopeptide repeat protein [Singulisphaera sp.]